MTFCNQEARKHFCIFANDQSIWQREATYDGYGSKRHPSTVFFLNQNGTVVKEADHMWRGVPVNDGWGSGHPSRRRADKCRIAAPCSAPLISHQEPLATPTSTHTGNRGSASYTGLRIDFNHFHCQVGMGAHWLSLRSYKLKKICLLNGQLS